MIGSQDIKTLKTWDQKLFMKKTTNPLEKEMQENLFKWFDLQHPELHYSMWHTPNGGSRHVVEAMNLKRQGTRKGVFDITLAVPRGNYHGAFIELKRKGMKLTKEQREFAIIQFKNGYYVTVHDDWNDARLFITSYLKGTMPFCSLQVLEQY
jgi:hypothetical protein